MALTPDFRVSYPNVFTPKMNTLSKKEEYSLVALFPFGKDAPEFNEIKNAIKKAIVDEWGEDKAKWPKNLRDPFRDQGERIKDGKLPDGYVAGNVMLTLKNTKNKPTVNKKVGVDVIPISDETEFYAGCWACADVSVRAYDQAGNRGVTFYLNHILKRRNGDPLSGRPSAQSAFSAVEGTDEAAESGGIFD